MPFRKRLGDNTLQPRKAAGFAGIDWGNQHAAGLFVAIPDFSVVAPAPIINIANRALGLVYNDSAGPQYWGSSETRGSRWGTLQGSGGLYNYNFGTGDNYQLPDVSSWINQTHEITISLLCRTINATDGTGNISMPVDFRNGDAANQHYPYVDNTIYLSTFGNAPWAAGVPSLVDTTVPHILTICYKNGSQALYQNHLQVTTAAQAVNPGIGATTNFLGGGNFGGQGAYVYAVWMWNRFRSQGQVADFCRAPFATYYTPRRRIISGISGGGGATTYRRLTLLGVGA